MRIYTREASVDRHGSRVRETIGHSVNFRYDIVRYTTKRSSGSVYCSATFSSTVWFIARGNGIVGDDFTRYFTMASLASFFIYIHALFFFYNGIRYPRYRLFELLKRYNIY